MDSTPTPGLRARGGVRTTFRVLGVVLVLVGFTRFAGAGDDLSGAPHGFVVFAAGGFLTVIGLGLLLGAGFMGASAGDDAGETMPVVKGNASYLTDGPGCAGDGSQGRRAGRGHRRGSLPPQPWLAQRRGGAVL
ncbi:MAG: hypothetical protein JWQ93_2596 [Marmoricola sp.]|jgi:hypothetical protein|nr:hypothetical protein [Marmoricola sp.]